MKSFILIVALLQATQDPYNSANTDFEAGRWADAAIKYESILKYDTKDIYCTPVPGPDGVVVGVLQLLNRTRPFTQQDYDFLKSVTEILGPVLKNAA